MTGGPVIVHLPWDQSWMVGERWARTAMFVAVTMHSPKVFFRMAVSSALFCLGQTHADSLDSIDSLTPLAVFDAAALEARALAVNPILYEKRLEIDKVEQKVRELDKSVLLPKFDLETGIGPAPGLHSAIDSSAYVIGSNERVAQGDKTFDFTEWGPYFGIELTMAQPLNIARYRSGRKAQLMQVKVAEAQYRKDRLEVSEEAQTLYYQRVYAQVMMSELDRAAKDFDKAQSKIQDMIDEGEDGVQQTDILELKAGRYALEKGREDAKLGMRRTALGLRFLAGIPDSFPIQVRDSQLVMRKEALPPLDTLKLILLEQHPDLQKLRSGLAAREELLRVARGQLGPDIFLFGNFKYTKAWSSDRESGGSDPFARDPLNELTGVGGLGLKIRLNFWQQWEKVRKERIELKQLRRTDTYAARGLLLQMMDAFEQLLAAKGKVEESAKSLRAAEAWLKAAAMKYDLDASLAKGMIAPYKTVLNAKKDYYEAVLDYNVRFAKLLKSVGWTLADYLGTFAGEKG